MACDHHVAAAHELFLSRLVETAFVRRAGLPRPRALTDGRGQRLQDFRPRLGRQRRCFAASAPAGRVAVTRVALSPRTVTG